MHDVLGSILEAIAAWKGVELAPGAELGLELAGFPSGGAGLLVILGIVVAFGLVVLAYRRESARLARGPRVLLATLRLAAVAVALLVLLEPRLVSVRRETRPGQTLVLVDVSQSMGQQDAWLRKDSVDLAGAWNDLGVGDVRTARRSDLAAALLDREALDVLRARGDARIYAFGESIEPVLELPLRSPSTEGGDGEAPDRKGEASPTPTLPADALRPRGRSTNPGDSLRLALERSRGAQIGGVVLIGDGRRNAGPRGLEIARLLEQRRVARTVVVPTGDPAEALITRLVRFDAPERVFQKDPFSVRATVETQGHLDVEVPVTLYRAPVGAPVDQRTPVAQQTVRLGGDTAARAVEVVFDDVRSEEEGRFDYEIELAAPAPEPFAEPRHRARATIEVLGESTRVLLVAGGPSHEYRILRQQLTRDRTIGLSCWLQSADPDFPQDGNEPIEALPVAPEELEPYDVLVLIDPDASRLPPEFGGNAAHRVETEGMGLWWVCGEKFTLDALRETAPTAPLAALLPVEFDMLQAERDLIGFGFGFPRATRYAVTAEGLRHKVTRLADEPTANEAAWATVPGFHFAFPVERPKPAATVLVEDPGDGRRPAQPLLATQFVGAGRVLYSGTDEIHDWRKLDDVYDRFWVNGIRYLFEGRLGRGSRGLTLSLAQERAELGAAVPVRVEIAPGPDGVVREPQEGLTVELRPSGESPGSAGSVRIALEPAEGPGLYEGAVRPPAVGSWLVQVLDDPRAAAAVELVVEPAALESEGPVDLAALGAVASVEGGVLVRDPRTFTDELAGIPDRSVVDVLRSAYGIWDTWITVLLLLVLLTAEWWTRKRCNLL